MAEAEPFNDVGLRDSPRYANMLVAVCCNDVATSVNLGVYDICEHRDVAQEKLVFELHVVLGRRWSLLLLLKLVLQSFAIPSRVNSEHRSGGGPLSLLNWLCCWGFWCLVVR